MDEQEVLKKLGFTSETEEELEQARKDLNSVEQLKHYKLKYTGKYDPLKDIFSVTDNNRVVADKLMNNYINVVSTDQPLIPIFHYRKVAGWHAYLNPNNTVQTKWEPPCFKTKPKLECETSVYKLLKDVVYLKGESHSRSDFNIEKGHLLGRFLNYFFSFEKFFGNKNRTTTNYLNEYPQFKRANENSEDSTGQQLLENRIRDNKSSSFYYEVEAIFTYPTDLIPIGTRIKIITLEKTEDGHYQKSTYPDDVFEHVFVPNCDYAESDPASVLSSDNTAEDYRKFFKKGDLKALKRKNIDFQK